MFFFYSINTAILPKRTRELIRDLEFRVLPCSDAWSSELSRITSGAPEKTDQDRVLDNDTRTANTTVAVEDKLQIKKDLIEFAQIWKKDHVSYSIAFIIHFST